MEFEQRVIDTQGIRLSLKINGQEVARAYLYIFHNDLHKEPVGYIEDLFVVEKLRGKGLGKRIVQKLIKVAKEHGCYKVIATSRYSRQRVHKFYECLGFKSHGVEFRIDL